MRLKRVILHDVPNGGIVRTRDGRWGVVSVSGLDGRRGRKRIVDFWDGGRELVSSHAVVELQT